MRLVTLLALTILCSYFASAQQLATDSSSTYEAARQDTINKSDSPNQYVSPIADRLKGIVVGNNQLFKTFSTNDTTSKSFGVDSSTMNGVMQKGKDAVLEKLDYYNQSITKEVKSILPAKDTSKTRLTFEGAVNAEGQYVYNSFYPPSLNGIYTRVGINGSLKLGKLPFTASVNLNFKDNRFWADYTIANINFDTKTFLNDLKTNYVDYLSNMENFYPKELSDQVLNYKDSLAKFNDLQQTLTSRSYYDTLRSMSAQLKGYQDSLSIDSTNAAYKSKAQSIKDSIDRYKGMAKEYADLEKYKTENQDLSKYLDKYNNYLDSVKNTDNILSIPGVKDQLKKAGILTEKAAAFSGVQKMGIGRVQFELSELTAQGQSVFGFNFDYLIKDLIYTGIGLGIASPNNFQFNPSNSGFNQPLQFNFNKFMGYLRFGVGIPAKDHIHLIYLSYGEKFGAQNSTNIFPGIAPASSVLSLEFRKLYKKLLTWDGEIATSNSNYIKRQATFSPFDTRPKAPFNFAARTALNISIEKTSSNIGTKLRMFSENFSSPGMPFMRRNFLEYSINAVQPLFNNKLNLSTMFGHNIMGLTGSENKSSFINTSNSVMLRAFTPASYTLTHTMVKQVGSGTRGLFTNHTVSAIQQYTYGKKVQAVTNLNFTFTTTQYKMNGETNRNTRMYQPAIQQQLLFKGGVNLSFGGGAIVSEATGSQLQQVSYWAETGNSFSIKQKASINYNLRYMKDLRGTNNYLGTLGINATLYKGLQLRINQNIQYIADVRSRINSQTTLGLSYSFTASAAVKKFIKLPQLKGLKMD